jgi:protein arginine kinase
MFEEMAQNLTGWLSGEGDDNMVVISTRVRLARNVSGCVFPAAADNESREKIITFFKQVMSRSDSLKTGQFVQESELNHLDKDFLIERHLMSPNFMKDADARALFIGQDEKTSIMINEEDHFRIQSLAPGLNLEDPFREASRCDTEINNILELSYDPDFGFLTACPTNVGTGMRTSVLIHLPGLVITKDIDRVISRISKMGVVVRGFYGEGTDVSGNLFQISNQNTLGVSENETIELINNVTRSIIEDEVEARNRLMEEAADQIEDKIWRAYGILKHARVLTSEEVMNLLSALRLGIAMKIIDVIKIPAINEILLLSQPAHLQKFYLEEMPPEKRDFVRAQMVREKIALASK